MKNKLLITVLALGAGLAACGGEKKDDASGGNETSQDGSAQATTVAFKVDGMT